MLIFNELSIVPINNRIKLYGGVMLEGPGPIVEVYSQLCLLDACLQYLHSNAEERTRILFSDQFVPERARLSAIIILVYDSISHS